MSENPFTNLVPEPVKPPSQPIQEEVSPFLQSVQRNRRRTLLIGSLITLAIGMSIFGFLRLRSKGGILISTSNATQLTVTLNERVVKAQKTKEGLFIPAYAGQYRVTITKPDYLPYTQDVLISKGQQVLIQPAFSLFPKQEKSDSTVSVDFVRASLDQKALFYLGNRRRIIYRMELSTRTPEAITDKALNTVTDIQWSGQPDVALVTENDGIYLQEIPRYDFQHQALVKLGGREIVSPIWDPTNPNRIAFYYANPNGERSLIFTNKEFKNFERKLTDLGAIPNPRLIWSPGATHILFIGRSADSSKNDLWVYRTADGDFRKITSEGTVLDASFSTDASTIIYETYSSDLNNPLSANLHSISPDGSNLKDLQIKGKVAQVAWKDGAHFYLPDLDHKTLSLFSTDGGHKDTGFVFDDPLAIKGMVYFPQNKTLIFYKSDAIFTLTLSESNG